MKHQRQCIVCGASFEGRGNQLYCSQSCKTKYHNQNRKTNYYGEYKHLKQMLNGATINDDKDEIIRKLTEKLTETEAELNETKLSLRQLKIQNISRFLG